MGNKTMNEYREEYEKLKMSEEQVNKMKDRIKQAKKENASDNMIQMGKKGNHIVKVATTAAVVALVFIALPNTNAGVAHAMEKMPIIGNFVSAVTFRDYKYDDGKNVADIEEPKLVVDEDNANLQKSVNEVNKEIAALTDQYVSEFKQGMQDEGYQDIRVKHEVIATTEDYFTLKLICCQAAGSGSETDYYYTINLKTGNRVALSDLFVEGADYITPISENIKQQMKAQMQKDENVIYWVDDPDVGEWNFKAIAKDQSFYLDEKGNLIICFNEGDVGPMCMGCVNFTIPQDVIANILKK